MKPIAIFRFSSDDGPGYVASFLDRRSFGWELIKVDEGAPIPSDPSAYAGLMLMGGPMSANDELPWITPVVDYIRATIELDRPCLGHCLGGQLISKALGGEVTANSVKEIGWQRVYVEDSATARAWLGTDLPSHTTFQWHGETFSIPHGAERILTGTACANQAFVIGKSLGMQCHTEMTPAMIEDWCHDWALENADPTLASIQTPAAMLASAPENMPALKSLADRLYTKWLEGVYRLERS